MQNDGVFDGFLEDPTQVLREYVRKKSTFFNLPDGEEAQVVYLGAKPVQTMFKGKQTDSIRFLLEVDGQKMLWDRTNRSLFAELTKYKKNDVLKIRREGERNQTKYFIQKVK